jgi:type VI secretion system protein ImpG
LLADTNAWFALFDEDDTTELPCFASGEMMTNLCCPQCRWAAWRRLLRSILRNPVVGIDMDVLAAHGRVQTQRSVIRVDFKLNRTPSTLLGEVDAVSTVQHPVINLYKNADPVAYDANKTEQWLPVDRMRPGRTYGRFTMCVCTVTENNQAMAAIDHVSYGGEIARPLWVQAQGC